MNLSLFSARAFVPSERDAAGDGDTEEAEPTLAAAMDLLPARRKLVIAYAVHLLQCPPVASVSKDNPRREKNAMFFARRDIDRVFVACQAAGLTITLTLTGARGFAQGDDKSDKSAVLLSLEEAVDV